MSMVGVGKHSLQDLGSLFTSDVITQLLQLDDIHSLQHLFAFGN
jgi:hypothetical protein